MGKVFEEYKLFVANLPDNLSTAKFIDLFCPFGEVTYGRVIRASPPKNTYGFISFARKKDALQAILNLNNTMVKGRMIAVHWKQAHRNKNAEEGEIEIDKEQQRRLTLMCYNLSENTRLSDLIEMGRKAGDVCEIITINGKSTRKGFVRYGSEESVKKALAILDRFFLCGQEIEVDQVRSDEEFAETLEATRQHRPETHCRPNKAQDKFASAEDGLYLKGIDLKTTEQEIRQAFECFGTIKRLDLMARRGFAFLEFEDKMVNSKLYQEQPRIFVKDCLIGIERIKIPLKDKPAFRPRNNTSSKRRRHTQASNLYANSTDHNHVYPERVSDRKPYDRSGHDSPGNVFGSVPPYNLTLPSNPMSLFFMQYYNAMCKMANTRSVYLPPNESRMENFDNQFPAKGNYNSERDKGTFEYRQPL